MSYAVPPAHRTLHAIGDVQGASLSRHRIMFADLLRADVPQATHRVTLGDCAKNANPTDDAHFLNFATQIPGGVWPVLGNHDVTAAGSGPMNRTTEAAAAALGMPAPNYVVDMGFAVLVVLSLDAMVSGWPGNVYGDSAMVWLDQQLTAHADRVCLIAAHAPLTNTVRAAAPDGGGDTGNWWSAALGQSALAVPPVRDDAQVRAVLADHPCAKAWISGHTHSPIYARDIVMPVTVGGHTIAAVNTSSLLPWGSTQLPTHPIVSAFITVWDNRIDVRWRDHGAHQWVGCGSHRLSVTPVAL